MRNDKMYLNNTYSTKVLNEKGEELFTDYDLVEAIENFDESNNLWYQSGILKVCKDGKYGIIDINGNEIANCEYDSITALNGVENSMLTEKNGKYGIKKFEYSFRLSSIWWDRTGFKNNCIQVCR